MICHNCGRQRRPGPNGVHARGECRQPWYQRIRGKHPLPPGRPKLAPVKRPEDISSELIERIMARRAAEQRYERAMQCG
jgi:hypothetical protein